MIAAATEGERTVVAVVWVLAVSVDSRICPVLWPVLRIADTRHTRLCCYLGRLVVRLSRLWRLPHQASRRGSTPSQIEHTPVPSAGFPLCVSRWGSLVSWRLRCPNCRLLPAYSGRFDSCPFGLDDWVCSPLSSAAHRATSQVYSSGRIRVLCLSSYVPRISERQNTAISSRCTPWVCRVAQRRELSSL